MVLNVPIVSCIRRYSEHNRPLVLPLYMHIFLCYPFTRSDAYDCAGVRACGPAYGHYTGTVIWTYGTFSIQHIFILSVCLSTSRLPHSLQTCLYVLFIFKFFVICLIVVLLDFSRLFFFNTFAYIFIILTVFFIKFRVFKERNVTAFWHFKWYINKHLFTQRITRIIKQHLLIIFCNAHFLKWFSHHQPISQ